MEQFDLTNAITYPSTTNYRVLRLDLNWADAYIHIELRGTNGERFEYAYRGAVATNLMIALNKANLSIKSLHRRVLEQLDADGILDGTISGTPD